MSLSRTIKASSRGLFFSALLLLLTFHTQPSAAQRATIAFWNTENLFDTIPSPFYDDTEWTPHGMRKWNTERYGTKIANLSRVLDELSADIVGLAELENEAVVRDLVRTLKTDYNYIHLTSGDSRGIDLALLYKGDKFFPDNVSDPDHAQASGYGSVPIPAARLIRSGTGREFLCVEGELMGERITLIVCHMASNLNSYDYRRRNMASLRRVLEGMLAEDPAANIVVMGDMNAVPAERVVRKTIGSVSSPFDFIYTPHWEHYRAGRGSYNYRGRWYLYDWMMTSPSLSRETRDKRITVAEAGIYARDYMTEPATTTTQGARRPLRTFYGSDYLGGFSDHFPVWIVVGK